MLIFRVIARLFALLGLAVCLGGCIPGDTHVDEEKDPHFQRGRNLFNSQDYKGAAEEYEKALESNPRSAAAHFELGCLYESKLNDCAAAIYHYERHLQLRPDSDRAQLVRQHIHGCKQELAKTEFPLPNSQNLQRELDRLAAENAGLKQQLAAMQRQPIRVEPAVPPARLPAASGVSVAQHARVHVVRGGETITSIAARYGLKTQDILAANPRVNPRRLRIGQSLNLP